MAGRIIRRENAPNTKIRYKEEEITSLEIPIINYNNLARILKKVENYSEEIKAENKKYNQDIANWFDKIFVYPSYEEREKFEICRGTIKVNEKKIKKYWSSNGSIYYADDVAIFYISSDNDYYIGIEEFVRIAEEVGELSHNIMLNLHDKHEKKIKLNESEEIMRLNKEGMHGEAFFRTLTRKIQDDSGRAIISLKNFLDKIGGTYKVKRDKDTIILEISSENRNMNETTYKKRVLHNINEASREQNLDYMALNDLKEFYNYVEKIDRIFKEQYEMLNKLGEEYSADFSTDKISNKDERCYMQDIYINGEKFEKIVVKRQKYIDRASFSKIACKLGDPFAMYYYHSKKLYDIKTYIEKVGGTYCIKKQINNSFEFQKLLRRNVLYISVPYCKFSQEQLEYSKNCFNSGKVNEITNFIVNTHNNLNFFKKKILKENINMLKQFVKVFEVKNIGMTDSYKVRDIKLNDTSIVDYISLTSFNNNKYVNFNIHNSKFLDLLDKVLNVKIIDRDNRSVIFGDTYYDLKSFVNFYGGSFESIDKENLKISIDLNNFLLQKIRKVQSFVNELDAILYKINCCKDYMASLKNEMFAGNAGEYDTLNSYIYFLKIKCGINRYTVGVKNTEYNDVFISRNYKTFNEFSNDSLMSIYNPRYMNFSKYMEYTENGKEIKKNCVLI